LKDIDTKITNCYVRFLIRNRAISEKKVLEKSHYLDRKCFIVWDTPIEKIEERISFNTVWDREALIKDFLKSCDKDTDDLVLGIWNIIKED
jgi:hypothetical protein